MSETDLELAARFVAVLYAATKGRPGSSGGSIIAPHGGIKRARPEALLGDGRRSRLFLHVSEPMVMLTAKGREAARG